ncbi:unknown [Clostridium sp. CAG:306]|nr:unknown [Clostridium sp. CAG:306]
MNKILETILRYLGQSSTYKGLFSVLAAFGVVLKPEMADAIIACALGIIGLINVIIDDHKHTTDNKGAEA